MNDILQKLLRLKTPVKIAATAGLVALIGVVYYMLFYMDMQDQIKAGEVEQRRLVGEKEDYEKRKKEYLAFRNELTQLQQEQRELLKALPKRAEIPTFLSSIQEQAELAGLEVMNLTIESESPAELYVRIPVRIEIRGSYHTITKFFKNVADLPRIVNVENLALSLEKAADDTGSPRLRARFYAVTFRYNDQPEAGGGT
ncbi:MAG TPA: type 4a pilus biogenesis protein PilO [Polyangia bacterium]|jgi:Tfp pilus assembly protein PilO|nr:type 4a pilus biogenesis protein PilO [Polyangia bacterium]